MYQQPKQFMCVGHYMSHWRRYTKEWATTISFLLAYYCFTGLGKKNLSKPLSGRVYRGQRPTLKARDNFVVESTQLRLQMVLKCLARSIAGPYDNSRSYRPNHTSFTTIASSDLFLNGLPTQYKTIFHKNGFNNTIFICILALTVRARFSLRINHCERKCSFS